MANSNIPETPVLLLTGYLGSGKTTLLNRILANQQGIRFAVIVNDIGEVNIDAQLIQQGGIVSQQDDSLIPLQNGCICCNLQTDLIEQLTNLIRTHLFDYIVIEASGICEPAPIAQTIEAIPQMEPRYWANGIPRLDCIATVVDALRLRDEYEQADQLRQPHPDEQDITNLIIQQIEFTNIILLNKADQVTPQELDHITQIIRALQPHAQIIPTTYCDIHLQQLLNTHLFNFDQTANAPTWLQELENGKGEEEEEHHGHEEEDEHEGEHGGHHHEEDEEEHHGHHHEDEDEEEEHHGHGHEHEEEEEEEHHGHHHGHEEHEHEGEHEEHEHEGEHGGHGAHGHHHHHHHDHDHSHTDEYGIGTYIYQSRRPMNLALFDDFIARHWPKNIIRAKGLCYFDSEDHICYLFEQAGKQFTLKNCGQWYATMPQDQLQLLLQAQPKLRQEWDPTYGDRIQKIVFIAHHLTPQTKTLIRQSLDACLTD